MEMVVISLLHNSLKEEWGLDELGFATLGSIVFAGLLVGNLSGGLLADKFGRRMTLIGGPLPPPLPIFLAHPHPLQHGWCIIPCTPTRGATLSPPRSGGLPARPPRSGAKRRLGTGIAWQASH